MHANATNISCHSCVIRIICIAYMKINIKIGLIIFLFSFFGFVEINKVNAAAGLGDACSALSGGVTCDSGLTCVDCPYMNCAFPKWCQTVAGWPDYFPKDKNGLKECSVVADCVSTFDYLLCMPCEKMSAFACASGGLCVSSSMPTALFNEYIERVSESDPSVDEEGDDPSVDEEDDSDGAITPTAFTNPLDFSTVEGFLASVLNSLRTIIAILAIIFMIIGGILYITSVGNEKQITTAKHAMTYAMVGLAIGVAAPSFLKEIATILEWGATDEELTGELTKALTLAEIGLNVLNFLLSIVGVLALIMMVVGGIMYFTAAADEKQVETAKKIFKYAIYGITISLASLLIVKQIGSLLV